ncbi:type II toxin-antitoxin system VapC family toxin [Thiorhodospira sibirica]|uniref:type II toxin-antitoxin system VapC family toxin n=1 Tax=Thiorhodospira sibirica TaxID=154347 RepID=UPI000592D9F7|nr:type II toxin-antitoxin system VapC family toxin [Thiorhodospira sibirica]
MILLDTHIWVRWVDPSANPLPVNIVAKIERAEQLAVSAITCWEVAWLVRRGRLELNLSLSDWLDQALDGSGVICLPINRSIAVRAAALPEYHRDPADRLIIATAMERNAVLISLDGAFADYFELPDMLINE